MLAIRTPFIIKKLNGNNKTKKYRSMAPKEANKPMIKN
jgi:hypothetical protein